MTDRASAALSKGSSAPDPLIGRVVNDRFKITALIARGGMGKVYRAEQSPLGRVCALKVLNPNYAGEHDPEFHKRFFLEASIASKLTHPNTVTIFDYGKTEDDIYYMAMEYLEGHTLHRAIRECTHFPEERAAHVGRQICRALREAHGLGVIHRDLKPANIFLVEHGDETDFVKVLDFGLVKYIEKQGEDLTQTGLFMGSPKYMSPEQIRGDRVDARTDIYALGIILYEMLTGKVPFDRSNSVNILMAHVNEEPPPMRTTNPNIALSPVTEEAVARCMAKDPEQRFRSMDEVLAALKRVGGGALTATVSGVGTGQHRALTASGSGPQPQVGNGGGHVAAGGPAPPAFVSPSSSAPGNLPFASESPAAGSSMSSQAGGGSKSMLLVAIVGAIAMAAVVGAFAMRSKPASDTATRTAAETAPVAAAAAASATATATETATAAPPAALVKVRVTTDPDGASVREDSVEVCTSTPCDIVYKGADADPTKEHKIALSRSGYRVENKTFKLGDSPVTVKLTKAPEAPRYAPAPKSDTPAVPTGYKTDIPY